MKDNKQKLLRVLQFAEVNLPIFSENNSKGWVDYGKDNLYGNYLINLARTSNKHGAILKRKVDMTASKGFIETALNKEFIENPNGENLDIIAFKCTYDLMIYGGYAINVIWSIDKTKIAKIEYVDFKNIRVSTKVLPQEKKGDIYKPTDMQYFWYSDDWSNIRKCAPQLVQGYSEKYRGQMQNEIMQGSPNQLFYFTEYSPGCDYYTLPDYIHGESYIALDGEVAQFHLQNVKQGFAPSYLVNFNTIPTDEEMDTIVKDMEKQYAGSANAGKVIFTFSDGKERAPTIEKIDMNASDERFRDLEEQITKNVFISHSCSEALLGGVTPGKLGGTQELINGYTIFKEEVIAPKQKEIEYAFNKFAKVNGAGEMKLEDYNPFKGIIQDTVKPNNTQANG